MATPPNSTGTPHIAVVEPQMEELFHAPFNASLLHTAVLAHPGASVSFQAFPAHSRIVREILSQHAPVLADSIDWRIVPLPSAKSSFERFLEARRFIRAAASSSDRVLFTSISRMQLLHLKRFLGSHPRYTVRAVLHGDLDRIGLKTKERFPNNLFPLERVLNSPHPGNLRYLLLSESIRQSIPAAFRAALAESAAIDHPYHFPPIDTVAPAQLSFGVFGNSGDAHLLEQVARSVKAIDPAVRFSLVGFVSRKETVDRLDPLIEGVTHIPIDRDTFIQRAHNISHALWLAPPNSFRLRASGTFFDALAYGKPLIYTANPYIDPYYAAEPAIGVRCETIDDVPSAILQETRGYNPEQYAEAQQAMQRLRHRFTPQQQAHGLARALNW
jgi:hypothetical protein